MKHDTYQTPFKSISVIERNDDNLYGMKPPINFEKSTFCHSSNKNSCSTFNRHETHLSKYNFHNLISHTEKGLKW